MPDGNHIQFDNHSYVCVDGSAHANELRKNRDVHRVYEVVEEPETDTNRRYKFLTYLNEYVYTGHDRTDGANSERRNAVQRILPKKMLDALSTDVKNPADKLIQVVVESVSLKVEQYPIETGNGR